MDLDVVITYKLEERTIQIAPVIDFLPEEEAVIVVNISVDEFGNVVEVDWDFDKTRGDWGTIFDKVLKAVREVKFNTITSKNNYGINYYTSKDYLYNPEPEYQNGELTFTFFV